MALVIMYTLEMLPTNVYYTKKKKETAINITASGGSYYNRNVNNWTEIYAANLFFIC